MLLQQQTKLEQYIELEQNALKILDNMKHSANLAFSLHYIIDALLNSKMHNLMIIKELDYKINSCNIKDC